MEIRGAAAVVFGGASGLGEATARRLAAAGGRVWVADRDFERAQLVAGEIGGTAVAVDVTDPETVDAAVNAVQATDGGLRACVNCAGIATPAKLVGRDGPTAIDRFTSVIDVNLVGTINVLRIAAAAMANNDASATGERGVCVNTASIAGYEGQIGQIAYAASKAGVIGLTLPAARELAPSGIRVNAIAPGLFDTPLLAGLPETARDSLAAGIPFPSRLGDPAEFAALAEHIITNPMLNGEVIRLDGALRMTPR